MKITIIGKSPSWQDAGGACSGYLVEDGQTSVLIDCGSGVFSKLRERIDHRSLDAIVISHLHADHILDLIPFAYGLKFGPAGDGDGPALFLPPGGIAALRQICSVWGGEMLVEDAFSATVEYDPTAGLSIDGIDFEFKLVPHFIDAWAVGVVGASGRRFVYGSDCGPSAALVQFATGADLLMLEATFPEGDPGIGREEDSPGHLCGGQAGELAASAGAARLILTHMSADFDLDGSRMAAQGSFGGPVDVAQEGTSWEI